MKKKVEWDTVANAVDAVMDNLERRIKQHGEHPHASTHETLGILMEEVLELQHAIHANDTEEIQAELADIAVVCLWGIASMNTDKE